MKDLNFTSFLMAIACLFLSVQISFAQTSADCQAEVNLSVGGGCQTAVPYEAFTSWRPSCMLIKQDGMTMAVIAGSGSFTTSKLNCFMMVDSVWLDTTSQTKINTYRLPMWSIDCDPTDANPATIYADFSPLPSLCNADTLYRPAAGVGAGLSIPAGTVFVNSTNPPACATSGALAVDGDLIFVDTVETYTITQNVARVSRVDTFSHTENIRWVKGTVMLAVNGSTSLYHGFTPENGKKTTVTCGSNTSLGAILGGSPIPGPNVLTPGEYQYEAYTPDSSNFCWGTLNVEYKLWPNVGSRSDTVSCIDVTAFDRSSSDGHYDYMSSTSHKAEDVCAWAEQIYTGGTSRVAPAPGVPGIGAIRSVARVQWEVNQTSAHCYTHTVVAQDRYIKNFDWLCDTVIKERTFLADKQGHNGVTNAVLAKDSLWITPINIDEINFPDSVLALKCGILEGHGPEMIAEYLYKAYDHFGHQSIPVITGFDDGATKGFTKEDPCTAFASQYPSYGLTAVGISNSELWAKVFQGADYNNFGVAQAFPYAVRRTKLIDNGLRTKIGSLVSSGVVAKSAAFGYTVDSVNIPINKIVCNIAATHIDLEPIHTCGGEYKILRNWSLVDWCTGTTKEQTQIIKFIDDEAPIITGINGGSLSRYFAADSISTAAGRIEIKDAKVASPWGCTVPYTFPEFDVKEHCSTARFSYELLDASLSSSGVTYAAGQTIDLSWSTAGFSHPIVKVSLYDDCGNEGGYYYYLRGSDALAPIVVVHDEINLTLSATKENSNGLAKLFCSDVDAGSHDGDCGGIADCKVRIKDSGDDWYDFVHFTCDHIGQNTVEFQAIDESGNSSIGWTIVNVENKLPATLVCENVTVGCEDPVHPDWIGYPHVSGICSDPMIEYEDEYLVDDLCFKGKILRTWTVVDSSPKVTCVQTIYLDAEDNGGDATQFNPASIRFPLHHTGQTLAEANYNRAWVTKLTTDSHGNCSSAAVTDADMATCSMNDPFTCEFGSATEPTWTDPACGLVGKTFEDQVVEFGKGSCQKILRHWAVIDWCTYDPKKGDEYEDTVEYVKDECTGYNYFRLKGDIKIDGYYSYTQELKVFDDMAPQVSADDVTVEVTGGGKTSENDCYATTTLTASAVDFCGGTELPSAGKVHFTVTVTEVDHDGVPLGAGDSDYAVAKGEDGDMATGTITLTGNAGQFFNVRWSATDGCNNFGSATQKVSFVDIKAPSIFCYAELSTSTMNTNGESEIWANDFAEAFDCGEKAYVWFKDSTGALVPGLTFTCEDLDGLSSNSIPLEVYAVDAAGNESFCNVSLRIIDGSNFCGFGDVDGSAVIAGEVRTESGDMVESAVVRMKEETIMTSTDGAYAFANNATGLEYELTAEKNDDHLNGVSTLDLVLIQKHILGLEVLNSPYKVIAADVNSDARVSAIDLVQLRKVILGIHSELPDNNSWRFVDANATFSNPSAPFPFAEIVNVDVLVADETNEDFIAVKIGDVSGNAIANSLITSGRNNAQITLSAQDQTINEGELVEVSITSEEFANMTALQFTLNLNGLEYVSVESGAIEMNNDNVAAFDGKLTAAWFAVDAISSTEELFTLTFRAITNTTLSNAISIGSDITEAVAYNNENEGADVALTFETGAGLVNGSTFELYQNQPNPFENITTIGFQLAEAGMAKMTVFDVTGKIVTIVNDEYDRGYNEITLSKSELSTTGVLYYQLESGEFTATRKMILID